VTVVFLDSGFLIALESSDDQHHSRAAAHWRELARAVPTLVTTSFVLDEVITFFNNRGRHAKAVEIGRRVLGSPTVRLIHVDEDLFRAGFDFLARHTDKRFSLTDCTSFVVMHRMGIHEALAFDAHFEQAGFRRLPD
jgi:uncharacterized protein